MHHAHVAGDRFDEDGGDAILVLGEQRLNGFEIVVGSDQRLFGRRRGHTRRVRSAERQGSRARLHQERVRVAVVAALELDEQVTTGRGSRQAQRAHRGLGTRVDEAHHLDRTEARGDAIRQAQLAGGGRAERGSGVHGVVQGLTDLGVTVTQDQRAVREHHVDVLVAIHVPDEGAITSHDVRGRSTHGSVRAHGAVDASGDDVLGGAHQRFTLGVVHFTRWGRRTRGLARTRSVRERPRAR